MEIIYWICFMPQLNCYCCKVKLPYGRFSPPSWVFLICQQCSLFLNCKRRAVNEQRSNSDAATNSRTIEDDHLRSGIVQNQCPIASTSEASQTDLIGRLRNQQTLVTSGLAESGSDENILNFINKSLLPALSISPHLFAVFAHMVGCQLVRSHGCQMVVSEFSLINK